MRLIDANRIMETVKSLENMDGEYADSFTNMAGNRAIEFDRLEDYIENAPTVDAKPVVHAHWIDPKHETYRCPNCGNYLDFRGVNAGRGDANYCPNCGAKMDEE